MARRRKAKTQQPGATGVPSGAQRGLPQQAVEPTRSADQRGRGRPAWLSLPATNPPVPHVWLLVATGVSLAGWLVFLAVMALRP